MSPLLQSTARHIYQRNQIHSHTACSYNFPISRDHHGLHIPSLLTTQLQGWTRELDVRLNSPGPAPKDPPMVPTPSQHRNLIRDVIVILAQYGLHYRDPDELIITNTLQLLLHEHPDKTLLGQPHIN